MALACMNSPAVIRFRHKVCRWVGRWGAAMKKAPLYSRSRQRPGSPTRPEWRRPPETIPPPSPPRRLRLRTSPRLTGSRLAGSASATSSHATRAPMWAAVAVLLIMSGGLAQRAMFAPARVLMQEDIDAAVKQTLAKEVLPSPYARAYAAIRPSVVRIVGTDDDKEEPAKQGDDPRMHSRSTGTGVVSSTTAPSSPTCTWWSAPSESASPSSTGTSRRPTWSARNPRTTSRCCAPRASRRSAGRDHARHR